MPVFFGADINGYSMARSFYERYKKKSIVVGSERIPPTNWSNILQMRAVANLYTQEVFLPTALAIANELKGKGITPLLVGCHDTYVRLIAENKDQLSKHYLISQIGEELLNQLIVKENLYQLCTKLEIDHPRTTVINNLGSFSVSEIKLTYPLIVKPSDTVQYSLLKFAGKRKVYIVDDEATLLKTVNLIASNGYRSNLIVQEYIVADETDNVTFAAYLNRNSKVKLASFLRHIVQEHVPTAFGMPTALIVDTGEVVTLLQDRYTKLLEEIKYTGHANFDIIYDKRDQKYKLLEINTRQGRSVYSLTAAGINPVELIIEDLVEESDKPMQLTTKKVIWSLLPKSLILRQIKDKAFYKELSDLIINNKVYNPLDCKYEEQIQRKIYVLIAKLNYYIKHLRFYRLGH